MRDESEGGEAVSHFTSMVCFQLEKVMSYGYSVKDGSPNKIGKYGNGLKA